ncbi:MULTISPECIES: chaplin [unclassified Kitasatospora]|uniref:chaplin n=1 Tax=unclassified Kitasatospora TaxID=2633591 RepID=UPI0032B0058F
MATGSVLASTAGYAYASTEAQGVAANSAGVGSGNSLQVPVDAPVNVCGNTVDVIGLLNPAFGNQCANASAPSHGGPSHTWNGGTGGTSGTGATSGTPTSATPGTPGAPGTWGGSGGSGGTGGTGSPGGSGVPSVGGSSASGASQGSPGVGSGNTAQTPVDVPVNACGNTVDVVGLGNSAMGNDCVNQSAPTPAPPQSPPPPSSVPVVAPPVVTPASPVVGAVHTPAPVVAPLAPAPQVAKATQLAFTGVDGLGLIGPAGLALLIGGGVLYRRSRTAA